MNIKSFIFRSSSIFPMKISVLITTFFLKKNPWSFYVTVVDNHKNWLIRSVSKAIRLTASKAVFIRSCTKSRLNSLLFLIYSIICTNQINVFLLKRKLQFFIYKQIISLISLIICFLLQIPLSSFELSSYILFVLLHSYSQYLFHHSILYY